MRDETDSLGAQTANPGRAGATPRHNTFTVLDTAYSLHRLDGTGPSAIEGQRSEASLPRLLPALAGDDGDLRLQRLAERASDRHRSGTAHPLALRASGSFWMTSTAGVA